MQASDLPAADRTELIVFIATRRDDMARLRTRMEKAGKFCTAVVVCWVIGGVSSLHLPELMFPRLPSIPYPLALRKKQSGGLKTKIFLLAT